MLTSKMLNMMNIKNIIKTKGLFFGLLATCLLLGSCGDLDIVPEGKTALDKTSDLELLLNQKVLYDAPNEFLGVVVNESYGTEATTLENQLRTKNTLKYAYLSYDESVDRAKLNTKDNFYTEVYSDVNTMNVVISKIDGATGDDNIKPTIKAEAQITRAFYLYLVANIYAKQYDEATVDSENGIAYPTDAVVENKPQLPLKECYEKMLEDCSDDNIAALYDESNINRITKCGGNAVKAMILFQMKKYSEALPYALKAFQYNSNIEDRSSVLAKGTWKLLPNDGNMILYISPMLDSWAYPSGEQLSLETVSLFEEGDYVKDHSSYWDSEYGESDSGIPGCLEAYGYQAYCTPWGFTVEDVMYMAAECYIRTGKIQEGLDLVNKVRKNRIDTEHYQPFTATNEKDAMALLQRSKFIECIGSYINFFDRKRWNTEADYKKTIVRDLGDLGKFTIAPDSKLWVWPFPLRVMQNNSSFKLNY